MASRFTSAPNPSTHALDSDAIYADRVTDASERAWANSHNRFSPMRAKPAPELGSHAHCGLERMLAARLRQIIRSGDDIDLQSTMDRQLG
jgi:hypothetical protein